MKNFYRCAAIVIKFGMISLGSMVKETTGTVRKIISKGRKEWCAFPTAAALIATPNKWSRFLPGKVANTKIVFKDHAKPHFENAKKMTKILVRIRQEVAWIIKSNH